MKLSDFHTSERGEKPQEMELLHSDTGKKTGVFLSLVSTHSGKYRQAFHDQKIAFAKIDADGNATLKDQEECACEILAAITSGVRGLDEDEEQEPSRELFVSFYRNCPGVRDQVTAWIDNLGNFTSG